LNLDLLASRLRHGFLQSISDTTIILVTAARATWVKVREFRKIASERQHTRQIFEHTLAA